MHAIFLPNPLVFATNFTFRREGGRLRRLKTVCNFLHVLQGGYAHACWFQLCAFSCLPIPIVFYIYPGFTIAFNTQKFDSEWTRYGWARDSHAGLDSCRICCSEWTGSSQMNPFHTLNAKHCKENCLLQLIQGP